MSEPLTAHEANTARRRGLTVSTMKHAHHGFDMDRPGALLGILRGEAIGTLVHGRKPR